MAAEMWAKISKVTANYKERPFEYLFIYAPPLLFMAKPAVSHQKVSHQKLEIRKKAGVSYPYTFNFQSILMHKPLC